MVELEIKQLVITSLGTLINKLMNKNLLETLTGLFVIFVAVFFGYNAYKSAGMVKEDDNNYTLKINFDRIDGLEIGGDVKISGLKVGSVTSAEINDKTYQASVNIGIDKKIKIPEDSSAEIISAGLLGDKYIAIVPGGSEEYLQEGDLIRYSQSSVSLEGLIGKFMFGSSGDGKKDSDSKSNSGDDFF